jgi:hypothetical protein
MSLAVFGVAVAAFAVYLLVQVRSTPAQAQAADHPPPGKTASTVPASVPPPVLPTAPVPAADPPHAAAPVRHVNPLGMAQAHVAAHAEPAGSDDPERAQPKADALMSEANKAYDRGDIDEARNDAEKLLAQQPSNVRMLRIVVSVACLDGDQAAAQKSYDLLPAADRDQMKTRCARSGVTFSDSTPPP